MTTHALKTWPEYYQAIIDGTKPFEVRQNDRGFAVGDVLLLQEYDPKTDEYTGRETSRTVTYLLEDQGFTSQPDCCVMGLASPASIASIGGGAESLLVNDAERKYMQEVHECLPVSMSDFLHEYRRRVAAALAGRSVLVGGDKQPWGEEPWVEYMERQREKFRSLEISLSVRADEVERNCRSLEENEYLPDLVEVLGGGEPGEYDFDTNLDLLVRVANATIYKQAAELAAPASSGSLRSVGGEATKDAGMLESGYEVGDDWEAIGNPVDGFGNWPNDGEDVELVNGDRRRWGQLDHDEQDGHYWYLDGGADAADIADFTHWRYARPLPAAPATSSSTTPTMGGEKGGKGGA